MKIIMRGGFRPGREGDDVAEARRRLQAALGLAARPADQQQHQQEANPFRVGNAAASLLAAQAAAQRSSSPAQAPQPQLLLPSLSASSLQAAAAAAAHLETQHPQAVGLLQERRLALQRAQLEAQLHAQAQEQAQRRVRALLEQEAETEEQIRRLQRQRQRPSQADNDLALLRAYGSLNAAPSRHDALSSSLAATRAAAAASLAAHRPLVGSPLAGAAQWNLHNAGAALDQQESISGKILRLETSCASELALQMQHQALPPAVTAQGLLFAAARQEYDSKVEEKAQEQDQEVAMQVEKKDEDISDGEYFRTHKNPREAQPEREDDPNFKRTREPFPLKLYRILHEAERNGQSDIVSFFPHGRAFAVHKSKEFIRDIMPKYFAAGRMNTFLKQLNLYAFRRITEGPEKGGYFHPLFVHGKRHQCKEIRRKKATTKVVDLPSLGSAEDYRQSPTDLTKLYQGQSVLSSPRTQKKALALETAPNSPGEADSSSSSMDEEEQQDQKDRSSPPRFLSKNNSDSS